jgi:hypothetical protein
MASVWYPSGLLHVLNGDVALDSAAIHALLVDTTEYTYAQAHDALDDVPAGARCTSGDGTLDNKSVAVATNVVTFDADNEVLPSVPGAQGSYNLVIIYYESGGAENTKWLLLKLELTAPIMPNGGDITLVFNGSGLGTVTATSA